MKKKILVSIFAVIVILGLVFYFVETRKNTPNEDIIENVEDTIVEDVEQDVEDEEIVETTQEDILSGSFAGEEALEQGFLEEPEEILAGASRTAEDDGFTLGPKQESIIYFSQIDDRWKYKPYTNHGDSSQTIGSSACGPTSAAMVVSGIKGLVYPDELADLYVKYGYRSYNSGTYLSAFEFTANYFDMDFERVWNLNDALSNLKNNNYVIVSCGSGLFTSGGHFIVLWKYDDTNENGVIDNPDLLHVYDPYLYSGKFNTSSRAGKVYLDGNDAQVTVYNFRNYANSGAWFCFPHNNAPTPAPTPTPTPQPGVEITGTVKVNTSLNVRSGPGTNYRYIRSLYNGNTVSIFEESNGWYRIGNNEWVYSQYVVKDGGSSSNPDRSTVGEYRKFKSNVTLYSNSNLTGTTYNYLKGTTVLIKENVSDSVDKIYVPKTGRTAYVSTSAYTTSSSSSTPSRNTAGQYKYLKTTYTYIYTNSNLSGTHYNYLAGTRVKILNNVSSTVDYIYVPKTGRYGYVKTSVYR